MHWQPMGMTEMGRSGAADDEETGAIIFSIRFKDLAFCQASHHSPIAAVSR
jgi:hypothetical protein